MGPALRVKRIADLRSPSCTGAPDPDPPAPPPHAATPGITPLRLGKPHCRKPPQPALPPQLQHLREVASAKRVIGTTCTAPPPPGELPIPTDAAGTLQARARCLLLRAQGLAPPPPCTIAGIDGRPMPLRERGNSTPTPAPPHSAAPAGLALPSIEGASAACLQACLQGAVACCAEEVGLHMSRVLDHAALLCASPTSAAASITPHAELAAACALQLRCGAAAVRRTVSRITHCLVSSAATCSPACLPTLRVLCAVPCSADPPTLLSVLSALEDVIPAARHGGGAAVSSAYRLLEVARLLLPACPASAGGEVCGRLASAVSAAEAEKPCRETAWAACGAADGHPVPWLLCGGPMGAGSGGDAEAALHTATQLNALLPLLLELRAMQASLSGGLG